MLRSATPRSRQPRSHGGALLALLTLVLAAAVPGGAAPALAGQATTYGPPYDYTKALMGQHAVIPLKDAAMVTATAHGYVYRAGQQDSHLVVTRTKRGVRFVDTGTEELRELADTCHRKHPSVGIAAVCEVPDDLTTEKPLLVEVWPRLGDDYVDGSALPATFAMTVLADEGDDTVLLGAGPDFFNGHLGRDVVDGGAGNDWIRTGDGADTVVAGPGDDYVVGMTGADTLAGADGDDRVYGGPGKDRLRGDTGTDLVNCGPGRDRALTDVLDRFRGCESLDEQ